MKTFKEITVRISQLIFLRQAYTFIVYSWKMYFYHKNVLKKKQHAFENIFKDCFEFHVYEIL